MKNRMNKSHVEGNGRVAKFEGCRSYKIRWQDGGETNHSGAASLATALYRAGRLIEIAKTDKKEMTVQVLDKWGRIFFDITS